MYKSPIEIIYDQIRLQHEGDIMKAVQKVNINVDKEELIKALQYDRGQYEKGFLDGVASVRQCGQWLGERGEFVCSICGEESPNDGYYPTQYCCHCGCVMDLE